MKAQIWVVGGGIVRAIPPLSVCGSAN